MGNRQGKQSQLLNQVLLSGKLGDGSIVTQYEGTGSYITFNTINLDYLEYRKRVLEENGLWVSEVQYGPSGYIKGKLIPRIRTRVDSRVTEVGRMTVSEAIEGLDTTGLVQLYLDDGTYIKRVPVAQLYVNSFTVEEVGLLIEKIYKHYPAKKCSIVWDKKRDGRKYPYLYIPKATFALFLEDIRKFLVDNKLESLYYKGGLPSTTIESASE